MMVYYFGKDVEFGRGHLFPLEEGFRFLPAGGPGHGMRIGMGVKESTAEFDVKVLNMLANVKCNQGKGRKACSRTGTSGPGSQAPGSSVGAGQA